MATIGLVTVAAGDLLRRHPDDREGVVTSIDGDIVRLMLWPTMLKPEGEIVEVEAGDCYYNVWDPKLLAVDPTAASDPVAAPAPDPADTPANELAALPDPGVVDGAVLAPRHWFGGAATPAA